MRPDPPPAGTAWCACVTIVGALGRCAVRWSLVDRRLGGAPAGVLPAGDRRRPVPGDHHRGGQEHPHLSRPSPSPAGCSSASLLALMRLSSIRPYRWVAGHLHRGVPRAPGARHAHPRRLRRADRPRRPGAREVRRRQPRRWPSSPAPTWPRRSAPASRRCRRGRRRRPARSGMRHAGRWSSIVIPQAFRIMIPPLTNELVLLLKDTSLVFVLGTTAETVELAKFGRERSSKTFNGTPLIVVGAPLPADQPAARRGRGAGSRPAEAAERSGRRRRRSSSRPAQVLRRPRGAQGHRLSRAGRGGLRHRPVGLGQVDAAALRQPAGGADRGQVFVEGDDITDPDCDLDGVRRRIGMVFQQFNLFPHLTRAAQPHHRPAQGAGRVEARRPKIAARRCSSGSGLSREGRRLPRRSSPAASSSAWRSPARWRWTRT